MFFRALVLTTLFFSSAPVFAASPAQSLIGKLRPDVTLPDYSGKTTNLDQWRNKVIVLNFWASWCGPCQKEVPMFNRVQKEYAPEGVQFIGLAVDTKKNIEIFLQKIPIEYPILVGGEQAFTIVKQYGDLEGVLPYTVFIDRNGKIAAIAKGGLTESFTRDTIEKLL